MGSINPNETQLGQTKQAAAPRHHAPLPHPSPPPPRTRWDPRPPSPLHGQWEFGAQARLLLCSPAPCPSTLPRLAAASPGHLGFIRRPQNRFRRCEECAAERMGGGRKVERGRRGGKDSCSSLLQGFSVLPPSQHPTDFPSPCPGLPAAPSFQLEPAPRSRMLSPSRAKLGFWLSPFTDFPLLLPSHPPARCWVQAGQMPAAAPMQGLEAADVPRSRVPLRCHKFPKKPHLAPAYGHDARTWLGNSPGTNHAAASPRGGLTPRPQGPWHPPVKKGAERSPRGRVLPQHQRRLRPRPQHRWHLPASPVGSAGSGDGSDPKAPRGNVCGARPREGPSLSCLINRED